MIKRTLEISREPAHLSVRHEQLVLKRDGEVVGTVPCEDIGVVLVDHPQTTYTHGALAKLAESDAAVVICGRDHLPAALLLPMADHSQVVWRLDAQLGAGRPLLKQLWRQLIVAKVRAQAGNLSPELPARRKLLALAREVRSGDPANIEAQAAKIYWANWLWDVEESGEGGEGDSPLFAGACELAPLGEIADRAPSSRKKGTVPAFRRDPDLPGLNSFLNYGYAVLRAAIARAIVAAGLLPSVGIHHRNRSNAFCLADDLIEPLRPLVDDRVREMHRQGYEELNQPAKAELLRILEDRVGLGDEAGPLMVELHRYVASLVRCFQGEAKALEIPVVLEGETLEGKPSERAGETHLERRKWDREGEAPAEPPAGGEDEHERLGGSVALSDQRLGGSLALPGGSFALPGGSFALPGGSVALPAESLPQRHHPVHGIKYVEGQPTIIFDTVCTKNRMPALANKEFHEAFRTVATNATAWLMGRYVIMPDHIHFFAGDVGSDIPYENWITYLKSQLTKALGGRGFRRAMGGSAGASPSRLDGSAGALPSQTSGSAGASPSQTGGSAGASPSQTSGSAGASPSRPYGSAGASPSQTSGSAGASPSRRAALDFRWQTDHWDTRVRNAEVYEEKWQYVLNNPVRKGLVSHPNDWPFQGEVFELRW